MSIKKAFEQFRQHFNSIEFGSIFDLESLNKEMIDAKLHGETNKIRTDPLGRVIRIGDIVSFTKIGGTRKSISFGIVLGFTYDGYRVARVYKELNYPYFMCDQIQTPDMVIRCV